ncbi:cbb3-type cytochrome c oxidase subunit 3 [Bradyrhizobium sp. Arg62]|uniref:cbb3-type cytochrome oxidase subunit 3 n=1 Tax=Bradyrhizobium brasilense TaxID=1419277 RepID=UPI001E627AE7|nr:cbb3-type cytochrome c oxidase subunit 3 [Bradyrhizobium brasilense]MCC8943553.1 cbb3-type cytochrome c oxidase subunit 3 [Bradyrhizobium brasilense]
MIVEHALLVSFSKSFGLFYLIALSVAVAVHAMKPTNKQRFDEAARSILHDEAGPWR